MSYSLKLLLLIETSDNTTSSLTMNTVYRMCNNQTQETTFCGIGTYKAIKLLNIVNRVTVIVTDTIITIKNNGYV